MPTSLSESRFESPVTEQNLPQPLLRLPDLAASDSISMSGQDVVDPPPAESDTATKPVRASRVKEMLNKVSWDRQRWLHAGRYALVVGVLGVLLGAVVLLIGGNGGPKLNDSEAITGSVPAPAAQPRPELSQDEAFADIDLSLGPQPTSFVTSNDSLLDRYAAQDQPAAKLLAPSLGGHSTPESRGDVSQDAGRFRQVAAQVETPTKNVQPQFPSQDDAWSSQRPDWRYENYPESNPKNYEYPSNTAPGWRIARQQEESRATPQVRHDGTWQNPGGFRP